MDTRKPFSMISCEICLLVPTSQVDRILTQIRLQLCLRATYKYSLESMLFVSIWPIGWDIRPKNKKKVWGLISAVSHLYKYPGNFSFDSSSIHPAVNGYLVEQTKMLDCSDELHLQNKLDSSLRTKATIHQVTANLPALT